MKWQILPIRLNVQLFLFKNHQWPTNHMIRESHDSWFVMIRRITNPNQKFWVTESESRIRIINSEGRIRITNPNLKFWGTESESRIRIIKLEWTNPNHESNHKTRKNRIRITNRIIDFELNNPNSNHMANHHFPTNPRLGRSLCLGLSIKPQGQIWVLAWSGSFFYCFLFLKINTFCISIW